MNTQCELSVKVVRDTQRKRSLSASGVEPTGTHMFADVEWTPPGTYMYANVERTKQNN